MNDFPVMSEVTELGNAGREGRPYLHACRDRSCVMPVLFLIYETLEQSTYDKLSVLDNFACFLSFANVCFFQNRFSEKTISGIPSECQTVWFQIRSGSTLFAKFCRRH